MRGPVTSSCRICGRSGRASRPMPVSPASMRASWCDNILATAPDGGDTMLRLFARVLPVSERAGFALRQSRRREGWTLCDVSTKYR